MWRVAFVGHLFVHHSPDVDWCASSRLCPLSLAHGVETWRLNLGHIWWEVVVGHLLGV